MPSLTLVSALPLTCPAVGASIAFLLIFPPPSQGAPEGKVCIRSASKGSIT